MGLKENVNRIHSQLEDIYGVVKVEEKSDRFFGNYIEMSVNESNRNLIFRISKLELQMESFKWSYLSNPEDNESVVERFSKIDSFVSDVNDIFEKNRFDSEYLEKLN
jgi:hypothetical protein